MSPLDMGGPPLSLVLTMITVSIGVSEQRTSESHCFGMEVDDSLGMNDDGRGATPLTFGSDRRSSRAE